MAEGERGESSLSQQTSSPSPPHLPLLPARARPRGADPLLIVCGCFSFVTAAASLLCVAVNVLSAIRSFKDGNDIFDGVFRCYAIVLALFVAVAETEWSYILKFWMVLQYWRCRDDARLSGPQPKTKRSRTASTDLQLHSSCLRPDLRHIRFALHRSSQAIQGAQGSHERPGRERFGGTGAAEGRTRVPVNSRKSLRK